GGVAGRWGNGLRAVVSVRMGGTLAGYRVGWWKAASRGLGPAGGAVCEAGEGVAVGPVEVDGESGGSAGRWVVDGHGVLRLVVSRGWSWSARRRRRCRGRVSCWPARRVRRAAKSAG